MDPISFTLLLDYLYNKFAVTFILSIIGVSIREMVGNVGNRHHISLVKIVASASFSTVFMCAAGEYIGMNFSVYVLVCIITGMWSPKLVAMVLNSKIMGKVTIKIMKNIAKPVTKSIAEALEETDNMLDADKDKTNSDEKNPKKDVD